MAYLQKSNDGVTVGKEKHETIPEGPVRGDMLTLEVAGITICKCLWHKFYQLPPLLSNCNLLTQVWVRSVMIQVNVERHRP